MGFMKPFIFVVGKRNAGKSTLIRALTGASKDGDLMRLRTSGARALVTIVRTSSPRNSRVVFRDDLIPGTDVHGLPAKPYGYYMEYDLYPYISPARGTGRLIIGANGEVYHTPNHYGTFYRPRVP